MTASGMHTLVATRRRIIQVGCDVARDGSDRSTIYVTVDNVVRCRGEYRFSSDRGGLEACADELVQVGVDEYQPDAELHFRIDTTGLGAGPADALRGSKGEKLRELYGEDRVRVFDVRFGSTHDVQDKQAYYDRITELYGLSGEALESGDVAVVDPPAGLEQDLTGREWVSAYRDGQWVKRLEPKDAFKVKFSRSPDHGDGFVLSLAPPEAFGVTTEVEYLLRSHHLDRAILPDLSWDDASGLEPICCGVDGWVAADGQLRLSVVVRGALPDGRNRDVAVAYLWTRGDVSPWQQLAELLVRYGVPWCVIQAEGDMWAPALDFATRIRDLAPPKGSRRFRKTALLRWRGNDARPAWRDKPHKELKLKGEELGYKHVVDWHKAHACRGTLERFRDGQTVIAPWGDLWAELPCDGAGRAEPSLRPSDRGLGTVRETCLGDVYKLHLLRTGFRRGGGELSLEEPFGGGFVVASALADVGLERMRGGQ